jgi:hypothetical protein
MKLLTPWLIALLLTPAIVLASETRTIELPDGDSMDMRIVKPEAGSANPMILGFPCDQGMREVELHMSEQIAEQNVEVWMADLLGSHFLTPEASSMRGLSGEEVLALIEDAHEQTGKQIYLVTAGFGAIPVLRGAKEWVDKYKGTEKEKALAGAILLYPELHAKEPEPGVDMEYMSITRQTSIPVYILQPENTPARWWLDQLKAELEKGGAQVTIDILPKVRGYFFMRANATEHEKSVSQVLPQIVVNAMNQMHTAQE